MLLKCNKVLKVVNNFQYTDDFPPLMVHLHHFHPSVYGLNLGSLYARSPGPRFHYPELHKQITDALLKCLSRLLIDNECRRSSLLCSMHQVPLARGFASYAPLPLWPTHLPADLNPPMSTHIPQKTHTVIHSSGSWVFKVNSPIMNWKCFDYAVKSPYMPRQGKGIHC